MEETKKSNGRKILLICIVICLIICLAGGGYWFYDHRIKKDSSEVSLKDDFYEAINYDILKNAKIPNDSGSWSKWYDAGEVIEDRTEELTAEILEDPNYTNDDVTKLLELYTDYEGRNQRGYSELQKYFDLIDNAKTIEDFNKVILTLERDLDLAVLINFETLNDFYDSSKTILFIEPITIVDIPFEFFTEKKYSAYVPIIEKEIKKFYEILGYDEEKINSLVTQLEDFAKTIQGKSIIQSEITDMFDYYKKYTLDEITNEVKNIPIKQLLSALKVDNQEYYSVYDMGHYKALDEFYTNENLPLIKEYAKLEIVNSFITVTTQENLQFVIDLSNQLNGMSQSLDDYIENQILAIKSTLIADELQKRYEAKYFTDEDKKIVADLVDDIKAYYKTVITNSSWLSETTKTEAIKKLDNMKVYIGYQEKEKAKNDKYKIVSKAEGGTFISNTIDSNRFDFDNFYKVFDKEAEKSEMNTLEVNAYYYSFDNSINFLAGFKELYENETNYYRLLGYFGTVIGHEISHAFDLNGSKFDETGKVVDWWTAEDKANYEQLTKKIEDYYSKYEYMGFKVDGKKTLSENIADLGAMKAMVSIAESKGATNEDFKKLFEAYADLWVSKDNKEFAEMTILSDTHSPNKIRVNAVLSSTDKFYEVYDIKENDKMYVPKEERVGLW